MKTLLASDAGYERRVPNHNRFELADYTPEELAMIFLKKAEDLKRILGNGVTVDCVASLIDKNTTESQRSELNGTIAENLLEATEIAMDNRNGELVPSQLIYEIEDVRIGASSLEPSS